MRGSAASRLGSRSPTSPTNSRLLFAGVSTVYLLVAIHWEERLLRRAFGAAYLEYARRVRWWRVVPLENRD
jgi:protein-S-isoprenylcysteine O-methyltransferase Ste14